MPFPPPLASNADEERRWNAVVIGNWNPAILTPRGIARRLFGLSGADKVLIGVPTDMIAPLKVSYEKMTVIVDNRQLVVEAPENNFAGLERAMTIAREAIAELPQTPFVAAGYNIWLEAPPDFAPFGQLWTSRCDERLVQDGCDIQSRSLSREIKHGDGSITFGIIQQAQQKYSVLLNFHRKSEDSPELRKWFMATPTEIEEGALKALLAFTDTQTAGAK
jgi:hypothetical protein